MSEEPFVILGKEIKRGESALIEVEVARLHTRNTLKMPVIIERGKEEGPVLLLIGGVHGDEINGVAIVRDVIRQNYNKPLRGTVICVPVFNVFGYLKLTREFPDGRDLNRMFPGALKGSLASQFAYQFTKEIASKVDYVLDFHTGGARRSNYPNVRCVFKQEGALEFAKKFGAPLIVNSKYIKKSLRETIDKMGKKIILFEGGKSMEINQFVVKEGVKGALNIMKHLDMQDGEPEVNEKTVIISKDKWLRAPFSGMFEPFVENGTFVKKREIMGRILDPYGEFEKNLKAPFDCYLFGLNEAPVVYKGDALFHISVETI
jgi:hypothetical protein